MKQLITTFFFTLLVMSGFSASAVTFEYEPTGEKIEVLGPLDKEALEQLELFDLSQQQMVRLDDASLIRLACGKPECGVGSGSQK